MKNNHYRKIMINKKKFSTNDLREVFEVISEGKEYISSKNLLIFLENFFKIENEKTYLQKRRVRK